MLSAKILFWLLPWQAGGPPIASAAASEPAPLQHYNLLDNGGFSVPPPALTNSSGLQPLPWWRCTRGAQQLQILEGAPALRTGAGEHAEQPVAAFAASAAGVLIRGSVLGAGLLIVRDGLDGVAHFEVGGGSTSFVSFAIDGAQIAAQLSRPPQPRFVLELRARGEEVAYWRGLEFLVPLPTPSESDLAEQLEREFDAILELWLTRALDREGPRSTAFFTRAFDVVTGAPLIEIAGGFFTLPTLLGRLLEQRQEPQWTNYYESYLKDLFELALHPVTGLPRSWSGSRDVPDDESFVEIAAPLQFLIDLAERGPLPWRERATEAAERIGESVLARGLLPDGAIAPRYRPRDGEANTSTPPLRALDLPAALARLGKLSGDPRYLSAVEEALARFEYTHYWPGHWEAIDPGFDDDYGHFGARAVDIWRALPTQVLAQRIALGGLEYYLPRWQNTLRLGGNVAADQVRCWQILAEVADLAAFSSEQRSDLSATLHAAVRSHFKGEQYGNGAWGDVTIFQYDPKDYLQVGDLTGLPQNLLQGIAFLYEDELGLRTDEMRALYAAVLESSLSTYRRAHGFLSTRREQAGQNLCGGELRLAVGLVEMLARL